MPFIYTMYLLHYIGSLHITLWILQTSSPHPYSPLRRLVASSLSTQTPHSLLQAAHSRPNVTHSLTEYGYN